MTDLPHIFSGDISIEETQVGAATTEFSASKAAQDLNFLKDQWPSLISAIATADTTRALVDLIALTISLSPGTQTVYTTPNNLQILAGFLWSPQTVRGGVSPPPPPMIAVKQVTVGPTYAAFGFNFQVYPNPLALKNLIVNSSASGTLQLFGAIVYQR